MKKFLALTLAMLMILSLLPISVFASEFDSAVSDNYFTVISEDRYALAPGATETELVLNNTEGSDRKVVHYFEVDTKNPNIEVLPGYYGIDKLDPDNLALDGVADKSLYWKAEQLTKTVAYYEGLGYNVVGAMNTALAYDSDAPYGYMVMNGVVLGTPEVHKGAQTYLAIDADGNCELRSMSTPLDGSEVTAISANFNWLVKDGVLTTKTVERTTSDASRSMIGIKEDGTLVFCQVDGRNAPFSTGLSNYEMGEMMLSIGCVNAVNCDGGGSSTFVSKREGETANTMRSVPSDGSERATINSVIIVSKAKATGEFDHAVLSSDYNYYAPGTSATMNIQGVDSAGSPAELPTEGITWALSDASFGTVSDGVFTSNGKKGDVTVQMFYNDECVGENEISVVDPDNFALLLDETVLPYGKSMTVEFACTYGADSWDVCVDGAYSLVLSDNTAGTLNGNVFLATKDESYTGVNITAAYIPNPSVNDVLKITFGKGSDILFDFEDGDVSNFLGVDEMIAWSKEVGATAPIQKDSNFSNDVDSETFLSSDVVKNGENALGVTLDYTDGVFGSWSYNMFFHTGDSIVLRDTANGMNATTFGMWVYIPEGAAGLAMQLMGYTNAAHTERTGIHFYFTTANGTKKNLNSCTEADIPESRWVYATADLTSVKYFETFDPYGTNGREPSFIRFYIKPTYAAKLTFYFDDFTLDYSSAVEDRVLPTITNVSYTAQDESVLLNQGATINANSLAFSAVVNDNIKLDNATGKIYVDGNVLDNVTVSGKYLTTTTNVELTSGVHTVAFEIKDTLGNAAKVTRTFTVAGTPAVSLSGHNDGGFKPGDDVNAAGNAAPECDSIYYVDVNVADITAVNKMNVTLSLQTGNTWEPVGLIPAKGFKVSYDLNNIEQIVTLTIERNGDAVDADATTIVSVPVRLWSWDGINHVTGVPVSAASHYATGNCPVVKIECEVLQGLVNDTDAFGGNIYVATKINDIVNPWHTHDAELTVLNKDVTCTVNGYTGRTYCETCQSVVDWGTIIEAQGHNYTLIGEELFCENCSEKLSYTGLFKDGENYRYFVNGNVKTGWILIGNDWYYFRYTTKAAQTGDYVVNGIKYHFEEDGKLTSGVWEETENGWRYHYGPGWQGKGWAEIDGNKYYFDSNGCRIEGIFCLRVLFTHDPIWYEFDENGVLIGQLDYTGFYEFDGNTYYLTNGVGSLGLCLIDGDYYYFHTTNGVMAVDEYTHVYETHGLLEEGPYYFDKTGKMAEAKNGIVAEEDGLYYYVNGKLKKNAGMIQIDGDIYFVRSNGKLATGIYNTYNNHGIKPDGPYYFDPVTGKLIEDGLKNGIVAEEDGLYYYVNGVLGKNAGMIEIDGNIYFVRSTGKLATGSYNTYNNNGILPDGIYYFAPETGILTDVELKNGIIAENDGLYYYVNGLLQKGAGMIQIDGDYYFVRSNGKLATGSYNTYNNNGLLADGVYEFDEETGKLILIRDGIVFENGELYYYVDDVLQKGAGMIEIDGDYYFVRSNGKLAVGLYNTYNNNGLLPNGEYFFDYITGKMGEAKDGIVSEGGALYYYKDGVRQKNIGMIEVDGDYYFVRSNGKLATGSYDTYNNNGYMPNGVYFFDLETGKLVN